LHLRETARFELMSLSGPL